jgi:hypothetical protein
MKIGAFHLGLFFLLAALFVAHPANGKNPISEKHALHILVTRLANDKLYDSWTNSACLSFITDGKTKTYYDFVIREKHNGVCPGDPDTAPIIDRFRVNRSTLEIEWFVPAEGEYRPYSTVLKGRRRK